MHKHSVICMNSCKCHKYTEFCIIFYRQLQSIQQVYEPQVAANTDLRHAIFHHTLLSVCNEVMWLCKLESNAYSESKTVYVQSINKDSDQRNQTKYAKDMKRTFRLSFSKSWRSPKSFGECYEKLLLRI